MLLGDAQSFFRAPMRDGPEFGHQHTDMSHLDQATRPIGCDFQCNAAEA